MKLKKTVLHPPELCSHHLNCELPEAGARQSVAVQLYSECGSALPGPDPKGGRSLPGKYYPETCRGQRTLSQRNDQSWWLNQAGSGPVLQPCQADADTGWRWQCGSVEAGSLPSSPVSVPLSETWTRRGGAHTLNHKHQIIEGLFCNYIYSYF